MNSQVDNQENVDLNLLFEIYNLAYSHYNHKNFNKIMHHFKPYFKYFKSLLKEIDENSQKSYFLITDDNSIVLNSLEVLINSLKNPNIEVLKAYDGVEALALFKIDFFLGNKIKYIISDQNMSMMCGVDLLNLVKQYSCDSGYPRLYISSSDDAYLKTCVNYTFLAKLVTKKNIRDIVNK